MSDKDELTILGNVWDLIRFLIIGLLVADGMWLAHCLGWL